MTRLPLRSCSYAREPLGLNAVTGAVGLAQLVGAGNERERVVVAGHCQIRAVGLEGEVIRSTPSSVMVTFPWASAAAEICQLSVHPSPSGPDWSRPPIDCVELAHEVERDCAGGGVETSVTVASVAAV